MKCREHPTYVARRLPLKTVKHPDGCPTCLGIWEDAKRDPKKRLNTVNIELTTDEARVLAISLDALVRKAGPEAARILVPFRTAIMRAIKETL